MSADLLPGHLGAPQSLNRYAYGLDDPINRVDSLGLDPTCDDQADACVTAVAPELDICGPDDLFGDCEDGGLESLGPVGFLSTGSDPRIPPVLSRLIHALITNSDCAGLFGGLGNALGAVFNSSFQDYMPGMDLPPGFDSNDAGDLAKRMTYASATSYAGTGSLQGQSFVFIAPSFYNYPLDGINSYNELAPQFTQTNIMFHEMEHIVTGETDTQLGNTYNDLEKFQEKCQPIDIPTENPATTGGVGP